MQIALVHLGSFGDCLYATLVARQIKRDHPGSHLTWVIGDRFAPLLRGNPSVDAIHVVPLCGIADADDWNTACNWVAEELRCGNLDKAYYTQILPNNISLYDGSIRATIYRAYGRPIRGPHRPELVLSEAEVVNVKAFAATHRLDRFANVFLFECGPKSRQSPMTLERAERLAHRLVAEHPESAFILTSDGKVANPTQQVIDGSFLAYRENAALARFCTGLVGCSSGITWLTTSTAGSQLPMLQILSGSPELFRFASVAWDFRRVGLDSRHIIEMADPDDHRIIRCIDLWIGQSHSAARGSFNERLRPQRSHATIAYQDIAKMKGRRVAAQVLLRFVLANGVSTIPWRALCSDILRSVRILITRFIGKPEMSV